MKIILARHGNTFGPGDIPVWVGAREDLALVDKGREQLANIGKWLVANSLKPSLIIAGPLKRTREGAEIAARQTGYDAGRIQIDERLKEIDYGSWGGKSDAEIEALYGPDVIDDWRERTIIPDGADWSPDLPTLRANAEAVISEVVSLNDDVVLIISSNGTLRYFHEVWYAGQVESPSAKVKTGHICLADWTNGVLIPKFWNLDPRSGL